MGALVVAVLSGPAARAQNMVVLPVFGHDATEAEVLVDVAPGLMVVRQRVVLAPQQAAGQLALEVPESERGRGLPYLRIGARLGGTELALRTGEGLAPGARTFGAESPLAAGDGQVLAVEGLKLLDWESVDGQLVMELVVSAHALFRQGGGVAPPRVAVRLLGLPADAVVRSDFAREGDVLIGTLEPSSDTLRMRLALSHDAFLEASRLPAPAGLSPDAQILHQALRLRAPGTRGDWAGTLVLLQTASESTGYPGRMARQLLAGLRGACERLPKEAALPGGAGFPEGVTTDADAETRGDCATQWVRGEPLLAGEAPLLPDGLEEEVHAGYYGRPRNRGLGPLLASVAVLMLVTLVWHRRRTRPK